MPGAPRPNNKATRIAAIVLGNASKEEKKKGFEDNKKPTRDEGYRTM